MYRSKIIAVKRKEKVLARNIYFLEIKEGGDGNLESDRNWMGREYEQRGIKCSCPLSLSFPNFNATPRSSSSS